MIYVDDMFVRAQVGVINDRWCHLFSDEGDEALHAFAASIGLKRRWFQHSDDPHPLRHHYDVTSSMRRKAIAAGAMPISWRTAGEMRAAWTAAQRGKTE